MTTLTDTVAAANKVFGYAAETGVTGTATKCYFDGWGGVGNDAVSYRAGEQERQAFQFLEDYVHPFNPSVILGFACIRKYRYNIAPFLCHGQWPAPSP